MELPLLVVAGAGPAPKGRNWLCKLNILNKVHQLQRYNTSLHKHEVVFNGELGLLKGMEAKFHVDPHAKPRFFKPRNVAYIYIIKVLKKSLTVW